MQIIWHHVTHGKNLTRRAAFVPAAGCENLANFHTIGWRRRRVHEKIASPQKLTPEYS